jgi:hypothetical protein
MDVFIRFIRILTVQKTELKASLSAAPTSSVPEHSRCNTASEILKITITIANNIAQNAAMHHDVQAGSKAVISIIKSLKVSGFSSGLSFCPSLIPACPL